MQINDEIKSVAQQIKKMTDVKKIMLFHTKNNVHGNLSGFKMCVITDTADKVMLELKIYREIESDIPFDVVIYTPHEWECLSAENGTFAHKVEKTGCEIIG